MPTTCAVHVPATGPAMGPPGSAQPSTRILANVAPPSSLNIVAMDDQTVVACRRRTPGDANAPPPLGFSEHQYETGGSYTEHSPPIPIM